MDRSGVGLEAATKAAGVVGGKVARPSSRKDFSDLLVANGVEAVATDIRSAAAAPDIEEDYQPSDNRTPPPTDPEFIVTALAAIPNPDLGRDDDKWNLVVTATWRASPNDAGLAAVVTWDKKSKKYNADAAREKWAELFRSPPGKAAHTLFDLADQVSPIWREVTPQQREEIERFASLPPLSYDRQRQGLAKKLGIRTATLDSYARLINPNARGVNADAGQGATLDIPEVTPYYLAVDGAELVADLTTQIRKYIVLSDEQALATAL